MTGNREMEVFQKVCMLHWHQQNRHQVLKFNFWKCRVSFRPKTNIGTKHGRCPRFSLVLRAATVIVDGLELKTEQNMYHRYCRQTLPAWFSQKISEKSLTSNENSEKCWIKRIMKEGHSMFLSLVSWISFDYQKRLWPETEIL